MTGSIPYDLSHAARSLAKNPAYLLLAVLTLALSVGVNAAIFSAFDAMILRPLPYEDSARLVDIFPVNRRTPTIGLGMTLRGADEIQENASAIQMAAAFHNPRMAWTGEGQPTDLSVAVVSQEFFRLMGISPSMGRFFVPSEFEPGRDRVIVLSHRLWQLRFAADPHVLGRTMVLNSKPYVIVGVAPAGFNFPRMVHPLWIDAWVPLTEPAAQPSPLTSGSDVMLARLKPGTTLQQLQAELDAIWNRETGSDQTLHREWRLQAFFHYDRLTGPVRPSLLALLALGVFILVIGAANLASLSFERAWRRSKEFAIRLALGASPSAIVRQLSWENLLLALGAGLSAFGLAYLGVVAFHILAPPAVPRIGELKPEPWLIGFCTALSLAVGFLAGMIPVAQVLRRDPNQSLHAEGSAGRNGLGWRPGRVLAVLTLLEVGAAFSLAASCGLLVRSLERLTHVNVGMRTDHVLTLTVLLPTPQYKGTDEQRNFAVSVLAQLSSLPGAGRVAATTFPLLSSVGLISHRTMVNGITIGGVEYRAVSPGYFAALGIPIIEGREFIASDASASPAVAIINKAFLRASRSGKRSPLREELVLGLSDSLGRPVLPQVVGVAGDTRDNDPTSPPYPEVYIPLFQNPSPILTFVISTRVRATSLAHDARKEIWSVDSSLPISRVQTLKAALRQEAAQLRFLTILASVLALLGLVLAAVGIYGTISHEMTQRTREIGIRMSLGAQKEDLLRVVMGPTLALAGCGIALGITLALAFGRLLASQLYGIRATDPLTLALVAAVILGVALLTAYLPVRRVTRMSPLRTLRHE